MSQPVRAGGRQIGKMVKRDDETLYVTERKEEDNGFVRKYSGFGIHAKMLKKAISDNADLIIVRYHWETGDQSLYKLTPRQWIHLGTEDKLGNFEPQIFCSCELIRSEGEQEGRSVKRAKTPNYKQNKSSVNHVDHAQKRIG